MAWSTYIPIEIPSQESMTDEEFFRFCAANKHIKIERNKNKQILIMPPAGLESDGQTGTLFAAIFTWNSIAKKGKCFGPSAGFALPDSSVHSPDVAWVAIEKWNALPLQEKQTFGHVVPDFIAEIMSPSDRLKDLKNKMQQWIQNGVRLGWLIDPEEQLVYIYREDGTVTKIDDFNNTLSGENVLPAFSFDLASLRL